MLPKEHNATVMKVKAIFAEDVKHRKAQQQNSLSLSVQQRYVLRELRVLFSDVTDEDVKSKIAVLETAFKAPVTSAVKKQLNGLRRNGIIGLPLLTALVDIYHDYGMKDAGHYSRVRLEEESEEVPRIVCSEALL